MYFECTAAHTEYNKMKSSNAIYVFNAHVIAINLLLNYTTAAVETAARLICRLVYV